MKADAKNPLPSIRWLDDASLLKECEWEVFRGSGPGGQKRNKTSSAVRLRHGPTGLTATATERRSQARNKAEAITRLRVRMTVELREPVQPGTFEVPAWLAGVLKRTGGRLDVAPRDPEFFPTAGLALDLLSACGASVADTSRAMGVSTASLVSFLAREPRFWARANEMRRDAGQKPLRDDR